MLQEAASAEQMSAFQKELEQLRMSAGQMKAHLEAAQQSQIGAQVPAHFVYVLSFHHDLIFCAALAPELSMTVCPYCWLYTYSCSTSFPSCCSGSPFWVAFQGCLFWVAFLACMSGLPSCRA